jgi:hypothetical protein
LTRNNCARWCSPKWKAGQQAGDRTRDREIVDKLTHEMGVLERLKFAAKSEVTGNVEPNQENGASPGLR